MALELSIVIPKQKELTAQLLRQSGTLFMMSLFDNKISSGTEIVLLPPDL